MWADAEGVGDVEDAGEGGGGVAAFPVAPVAEVDAYFVRSLALGEGWVVVGAEPDQEGWHVGAHMNVCLCHEAELTRLR